jgi:hypothetical protein
LQCVRVPRSIATIAALGGYVVGCVVGCNAILGIEDRRLRTSSADASSGSAVDASPRSSPDGSTRPLLDASAVASPYAQAVLADQPVVYLRFGERSGSTVHDEMGHFTGRYPAAAATLGYAGAIAGDPDTAVLLDGTEGIVMSAGVDFSPMDSYSLEIWVRLSESATPGDLAFVVDHETFPDGGRAGWNLELTNGAGAAFERWVAAGDDRAAGTAAVSSAQWHHVVGTFDAATGRMVAWLDGVAGQANYGAIPILPVPEGWTIGAENCDCSPQGFVGAVDELAIYAKVLPDARVKAHYAAAGGK